MDQRVSLLTERLDVIADLLAVLKDQLSHGHGEKLEWIGESLVSLSFKILLLDSERWRLTRKYSHRPDCSRDRCSCCKYCSGSVCWRRLSQPGVVLKQVGICRSSSTILHGV